MGNETLFNSVTDFHTVFMQGLDEMLQNENLDAATFNLVFGNTILHHKERDLINRLESAKLSLASRIDRTKTDDDTVIFLELCNMKLDWQNWTMIEDQKINSWNVQLNKFRVLKPKGFGVKKITEVHQKFNGSDFNFNKVTNPTIWSGLLNERQVSLYYNKFPYKDLQSLLVIEPAKNMEQYLTLTDHQYVWEVCQSLKHLDDLFIGYNSLGAFASVNHLHFHLMIGIEELTVIQDKWLHNGGTEKYPAEIFVFKSALASWDLINFLNTNNIAYNMLYTPGKIYIYPRRFQGTYTDPLWSTGLGWYEFSGNFIIYDENGIKSLSDSVIRDSLAKASQIIEYNINVGKFVKVANIADIKENVPFCAETGGQKLAIYKVNGKYYAINNICTHAGGPLCMGELNGSIVTCPWHGSKFDVTTGIVVHPPATKPIQTYKTQINGDALEVELI